LGGRIDQPYRPYYFGQSPIANIFSSKEIGPVHNEWSRKMQGVTSDGRYWFFSTEQGDTYLHTRAGIAAFDLYGALDEASPTWTFQAPDAWLANEYQHLGDIDYDVDRSSIWMVVENEPTYGPDFILARLSITSPHGGGRIFGARIRQANAPWCALHRPSGFVVSSDFDFTEHDARLYMYDPDDVNGDGGGPYGSVLGVGEPSKYPLIEPRGTLPLLDEDGISLTGRLAGIQGGAFTPQGHLLLAVQDMAKPRKAPPSHRPHHTPGGKGTEADVGLYDPDVGGIMAFDMFTGRRVWRQAVDFRSGEDVSQELEGLACVDYNVPMISSWGSSILTPDVSYVATQIHGGVGTYDGAFWFKHYGVLPGQEGRL
jgi:hypothetical protein